MDNRLTLKQIVKQVQQIVSGKSRTYFPEFYRMNRIYHNKYIPGGAKKNVKDAVVRNPKIAAHVNMMWEKFQ